MSQVNRAHESKGRFGKDHDATEYMIYQDATFLGVLDLSI